MSTDTPDDAHEPPAPGVPERQPAEQAERYARLVERLHEDLVAERTQLEAEVARLERRLERKESQLNAIVAHNERVLEEFAAVDRRELAERDRPAGPLDRLKRWLGR